MNNVGGKEKIMTIMKLIERLLVVVIVRSRFEQEPSSSQHDSGGDFRQGRHGKGSTGRSAMECTR
jgi:hypothetical protein